MYQPRICPHDNLSPVEAWITKFGPEALNTLVKIPIVLGVHWPWTYGQEDKHFSNTESFGKESSQLQSKQYDASGQKGGHRWPDKKTTQRQGIWS